MATGARISGISKLTKKAMDVLAATTSRLVIE
jgi:hypothetical protein